MSEPRRSGLWRHPDFLKLWGGQAISEFGSQFSQLAIPLIAIIVLKATPFEVGLLSAVEFAPFLLVGLPAGAIVDRLHRRPVLIAGDAGRAALLASIPLAYAFDALTLPQLYVVGFLVGILTVFFDVAYQSYLPALVERHQLADGNGKLTVTSSAAQLTGPGVAGALVGAAGGPAAVLVDAVSFVVSALSVSWIRRVEPPIEQHPPGARPTIRRDVAEGLRFVLGHPLLRRIAGCTGTSNLGSSLIYAVITVYMVRRLHLAPATIGLVFSVGSSGFLLGALVANRISGAVGLGRAIVGSAATSGAGALVLILVRPGALAVPLLIAAQFVTSFAVPVYNIGQVSLRQAITPDRLQGRMNASMRFIVWGTMPIGSTVGGLLGGLVGLHAAVVVGAVVEATSFLWVLTSPVRSLPGIPEPVEELPPGTLPESATPVVAPEPVPET